MTLYPATLAAAAFEGWLKIVVMTSLRRSPSPRDACQARIIATLAQIAADPDAGWRLTRSIPEISASMRSSRHRISRVPW